MADYRAYYEIQAGNGIAHYSGMRYQRGSGLWGRIFSSAILPALKFLGTRAINTAANVTSDSLSGVPLKEAIKSRLQEEGRNVANVASNRAKVFVQTGKGRKRPTAKKAVPKKTYKRSKTRKDIF